jgi:uncharacterized membrane protein HdeD (DUF308 family)
MSTTAGQELRPLTSLWWLPLLFGVAALCVGIFFVVSPHETLSTFTAIAGIFVLVDGVIAIATSMFGSGDGRGLLALIGVLSAIAGLILIKKPFETLVVFTLIVGVWFVVASIVRLVSAFDSREARGGNILVALLDLTAGGVILAWPDLGLATLAVIIGIVLVVRGALFIATGWQLRALDRAVATGPGEPAVA